MLKSADDVEEYRAQLESPTNPYWQFFPALEVRKWLEDNFSKNDNPGIVIGGHLKAIFGTGFSAPHNELPPDIERIHVERQTLRSILIVVALASMHSSKECLVALHNFDDVTAAHGNTFGALVLARMLWDGCSKCSEFLYCLDSSTKADFGTDFFSVIKVADGIRQGLFETTMRFWLLGDMPEPAFDCFAVLSQFQFGKIHPAYLKDNRPFAPFNKDFLQRYGVEYEYAGNLPFVPWEFFPKLIERYWKHLFETDDSEASGVALKAICQRYAIYRQHHTAGYSPLSLFDTYHCSGMSMLPFRVDDVDDLALHMSPLGTEDLELFQYSGPWGVTGEDEPQGLTHRANTYCRAVDLAFSEGYNDLAVALLTFFVATQSSCGNGALYVPWSRVVPLIEKSISTSSRQSLVRGLQIAQEFARQGDRPIEVAVFEGFVREHSPRPDNVVRFTPPKTRSAIEQSMLEQFGDEARSKLSERSWSLLLESEIMWERLYKDFGATTMDWGVIALAHVKPLEAELVERLGRAYGSDEFRSFSSSRGKTASVPTLGPLLHMLKDYSNLPASVKKDICDSGVKLQTDAKHIRDLLSIVNPLRNLGTHTEPFTEANFIQLKGFLFRDGGYKRFFSLLE
jgi:hypothetical protein